MSNSVFQQGKSKAQELVKKARNVILDEIRGAAAIGNANGSFQLSLFAQIVGALPKYLTNQKTTPGQLPSPEEFLVSGIKFSIVSSNGKPVRFRDAYDIMSQATFTFSVSQIPVLEGWVAAHIPSNIIVPLDGKPEQTESVNLAAYVNLAGRPIWIASQKAYAMDLEYKNQCWAAAPNDYATLYGTLYFVCTLYGQRSKAVN
jgi:hypothetical protein